MIANILCSSEVLLIKVLGVVLEEVINILTDFSKDDLFGFYLELFKVCITDVPATGDKIVSDAMMFCLILLFFKITLPLIEN